MSGPPGRLPIAPSIPRRYNLYSSENPMSLNIGCSYTERNKNILYTMHGCPLYQYSELVFLRLELSEYILSVKALKIYSYSFPYCFFTLYPPFYPYLDTRNVKIRLFFGCSRSRPQCIMYMNYMQPFRLFSLVAILTPFTPEVSDSSVKFRCMRRVKKFIYFRSTAVSFLIINIQGH